MVHRGSTKSRRWRDGAFVHTALTICWSNPDSSFRRKPESWKINKLDTGAGVTDLIGATLNDQRRRK
jgi:hypothetical protein